MPLLLLLLISFSLYGSTESSLNFLKLSFDKAGHDTAMEVIVNDTTQHGIDVFPQVPLSNEDWADFSFAPYYRFAGKRSHVAGYSEQER